MPRRCNIYLIAGEPSGDALGARLITSLRARRPDLAIGGIGGPLMAAQGLSSLFPMGDLALMGLMEILPRILRLRARLAQTVADLDARRPDLLVTIDSPGFTLRVLRAAAGLGIARIHYVAPQVWAWREGRVRGFPGLWDRLLCLLPFEPAFFARHGLPASFVGHPVLDSGAETGDAGRFRDVHGLAPDARVLVVMPGSRRTEVARLLPIFAAALARLDAGVPDAIVPVVVAAPDLAATVRQQAAGWARPPIVISATADKHDAFAAASAALTKSGTSTLELAMAGVPMAVAYRVNPITAAIARRLIRVRYASLVNLLADRAVAPELIQSDCTPERIAATIAELLTPAAAAAQRAAFREVLAALAPPQGSPSDAAAAAVLDLLEQLGRQQP